MAIHSSSEKSSGSGSCVDRRTRNFAASRKPKETNKCSLTLSTAENTQVLITTHSATIVKELNFENIRIIQNSELCRTIQRVLASRLPYPSLNEVNYLAFSEISEEYHNELYGYIEERGLLNELCNNRGIAIPEMGQNKIFMKRESKAEISNEI